MLPARLQLTLPCVLFPLLRLDLTARLQKDNNNKPPSSALPQSKFEILLINRTFMPLAAVPAQEGKPGNRSRESALVPEAFTNGYPAAPSTPLRLRGQDGWSVEGHCLSDPIWMLKY